MARAFSHTCGDSTHRLEQIKNLDTLAPGEQAFVFTLRLADEAVKELKQVGINRNDLVETICRTDSTLIIAVGDRRVAVDRDTASNILVHPV